MFSLHEGLKAHYGDNQILFSVHLSVSDIWTAVFTTLKKNRKRTPATFQHKTSE